MSLPDTIFIFALALVIFGPKKLPEIGRQIGKLVFEFRRASNEFKMQIDEELRAAEQADRQKKIAAETAGTLVPAVTPKEAMIVRPPSTGTMVSTDSPSSVVPVDEEVATLEEVSPTSRVLEAEGRESIATLASGQTPEMDAVSLPAPSQPEQANLPLPAENAVSPAVSSLEEAKKLEAALPANSTLTAEEHIREQIATHHG